MDSHPPGRSSRLLWSLRHYGWLAVACMLAFAAVPLLLGAPEPTYQARAVVVASQLTINPRALPQLAEAVFADGAVEARVADDPAVTDATRLIPDVLSVVAPADSVALIVQARDADPVVAARLADIAAEAFVTELNRGGAGVGQFTAPSPAVVPTEPLPTLATSSRAAIGALAGLVLGLGLAALTGAIRRPVIAATDVEAAVGVPLLGTVQLPAGSRSGYQGPLGVRGIATVTRWLATVPAGRLLMLSPPWAVALRQRLYVMIGVALSTVRPVRFAASPELVDAIEQHRLGLRETGRADRVRSGSEDELLLVDGGSALETLDPAGVHASVVAVVPRGISRRRLRLFASDYRDGGLVGVVLVDLGPRLRRTAARRATPRTAAAATANTVPVGVPEPGRT